MHNIHTHPTTCVHVVMATVTVFLTACERENADMADLLVQAGASVNQRCAQGWTALHQAVSRDNTTLCDTLLAAGANLNPSNTHSITPLIVAAQQGRLRALGFLLGKGTGPAPFPGPRPCSSLRLWL